MASPWLSMETEEQKKQREEAEKKAPPAPKGPTAQPQGDVEGNQKTIANFFRKR